MSVKKRVIYGSVISALAFGAIWLAVWMVMNGIILLNNPSEENYPVRGVDVSHYQGEINWETLSENNIDFAFIKATEGSTYVDECFEYNWNEALKTKLHIGAYHFFSFESEGKSQAENFIANVPKTDGTLPPVIDIEFYGDIEKAPPKKEEITAELDILIETLSDHYGRTPIIYTTQKCYKLYISNGYEACDIWIRDVIMTPSLSDGRNWTFWQYTDREMLDGYNGEEKFIDMNVFNGSKEDFYKYCS